MGSWTAQIANTVNEVLEPPGVGVVIKASNYRMVARGVHNPTRISSQVVCLAASADYSQLRQKFLSIIA